MSASTAVVTHEVWATVEVDGVPLPVFNGQTYPEYVAAWRDVTGRLQKNYWMLGAIAVRLLAGQRCQLRGP